ncbi:TPA: integrase, partial [Staphylococcus aureus]|nr:integrase [Staphylococcus aureus]
MSKSSDALFNSLTQSFELIEGVYNELVTDN